VQKACIGTGGVGGIGTARKLHLATLPGGERGLERSGRVVVVQVRGQEVGGVGSSCMGCLGGGVRGAIDVTAGVLLLPFGPAVLEPDFHLSLGQ